MGPLLPEDKRALLLATLTAAATAAATAIVNWCFAEAQRHVAARRKARTPSERNESS